MSASAPSRCPLTSLQNTIWAHQKLHPDVPIYNLAISARIDGDVDVGVFEQALEQAVAAHDVLRLVPSPEVLGDGEPQLLPQAPVDLMYLDFSEQDGADERVLKWMQQETARSFPIGGRALFQFALLKVASQRYYWFSKYHALLIDGCALTALVEWVAAAYTALLSGQPVPESSAPAFAAVVQAEQSYFASAEFARDAAYWRQVYTRLPEPLFARSSQRAKAGPAARSHSFRLHLASTFSAQLRSFAAQHQTTLVHLILGALYCNFTRTTQSEDLAIGISSIDKCPAAANPTVALRSNTIAAWYKFDPQISFVELLQALKKESDASVPHKRFPLSELARTMGQSEGFRPFDVTLTYLKGRRDLRFGEAATTLTYLVPGLADPGLNLYVEDFFADGSLSLLFDGSEAAIAPDELARIAGRVERILGATMQTPGVPIWQLPLLSERERQQILVAWNDTRADFPRDACIHQLFEEQVARTPDAAAILDEGQTLSYRELNGRANQLAHHLRLLGVGPQVLVGLCIDRSWEMIVGLLGIMKAGGIYVPLDPDYPAERLAFMAQDAQIGVLVTHSRVARQSLQCILQKVDLGGPAWQSAPRENLANLNRSAEPLYVIYTSGSTGTPKGVLGTHRGTVNRLHWMWKTYPFSADEVCCIKTVLNFGDSVAEILSPLLQGIKAVLIPDRIVKDPVQLVDTLRRHDVTRIVLVPSWLSAILQAVPELGRQVPKLRYWVTSGEALPLELARQLLSAHRSCRLLNLYGASELSADVTCYELPALQKLKQVLIGRPIANTQIYILDAHLQPVPIGAVGEIHVGGVNLAQGYLNRAALTAEKFIPDPFSSEFPHLYKTGDLGRFLPDGNIEFLGRVDSQVKVRGFRIELGEIETVLSAHPAVQRCVVMCREFTAGDNRLCAYIVQHNAQRVDPSVLRQYLADRLPEYMLPSYMVYLDALPLTPSGKIDRRSLPDPERQIEAMRPGEETAAAPQKGGSAREIAALIASVLGLPYVDPEQPLRELGANSLTLVQIHSRLRDELKLEVQVTELFNHPTVASLVRYLGEQGKVSTPLVSESRQDEPLAIVAMACRLPGGVKSAKDFWRILEQGIDAIEPLPAERWDVESIYDPDPAAEGKTYCRYGGFVHQIDRFDAAFFGIAPREAQSMDPQQRLILETVWEALEQAGIPPGRLADTQTGVYLGAESSDYPRLTVGSAGLRACNGYGFTGHDGSVLSGRVAYTLNLRGPAMTVHTACSSSLVALHLASQALRNGDCDVALTGGVTVMNTPAMLVEFSRLRGLAVDGRCKSFSAQADGAGWSEGAGILLLKRLRDAERDGDPVLAVLRGTAVNQDGRSQGLTAPNGPAQERVIRQALAQSGLSPTDIDAVEAHGTGTRLGDPIEAGALSQVFGPERDAQRPLYLGSSKSNLGHTGAAAGVTGVIKMVLSLQNQLLPRTLHAEEPSSHVSWENSGLSLLTLARPWPRGERVRRAGVSGFGVGGTNAHVILEEAPRRAPAAEQPAQSPGPMLFVLSGKTEAALQAQAQRLAEHVEDNPAQQLADIAYTLGSCRTHFAHRVALVCTDRAALTVALQRLGQSDDAAITGTARVTGKLAFVFPGQGSQWPAMGRSLLETSAVFAAQIQACAEAFSPYLDFSLLDVLRGEAPAAWLERTEVVQPALFAMQVSLAALWQSLGVRPDVVLGHSQGEVAAAYVAGALTLPDAARVVALRSRAVRRLEGQGAMAAVELPAAQVQEYLSRYGGQLSLAAENGPSSCLVSGQPEALEALLTELHAAHAFAKVVRVRYASHCVGVETLREELLEQLAEINPRPAAIPMQSTVTNQVLIGTELGAEYWYANLRQPVRFAQATQQLIGQEVRFFVEVSAHPVLMLALQEGLHAASAEGVVTETLRREQGELERIQQAAARLHTQGAELDWDKAVPHAQRVELPTYAFQRQRYWVEEGSAADVTSGGLTALDHPLLGAALRLAERDAYRFTARLSLSSQPILDEHRVFGRALFPGTGHLDWALSVAQTLGMESVVELSLATPLWLARSGATQVQLSVDAPDARGQRPIAIYSRPEGGLDTPWVLHAMGILGAREAAHSAPVDTLVWPPKGAQAIDGSSFYEGQDPERFFLGPEYQALRAAWKTEDAVYAHVVLSDAQAEYAARYSLHPVLLDAALHALEWIHADVYLPLFWQGATIHASGARELWVRMATEPGTSPEQRTVSLQARDPAGLLVAQVDGLILQQVRPEQLRKGSPSLGMYAVRWENLVQRPGARVAGQGWVLGTGLCRQLGLPVVRDLAELHARLAEGVPPPALLLWDATEPRAHDLVEAAHHTAHELLAGLKSLVANDKLASCALVVVTQDAVCTGSEDTVLGLSQAPLWGLLRSARSEHPDRTLRLLDLGANTTREQIESALLLSDEPELALRGVALRAPRLVPVSQTSISETSADRGPLSLLAGPGTVLITGGTGELASHLAMHLVRNHDVRSLLLTSRRGMQAQGASELVQKLTALGAQAVTIAPCDVSDRAALSALLDRIPKEVPLRAVFHCAGVLDDGMLLSQTPDRLDRVFAPKVDAAWHLHELTRGMELDAFVMYSSVASTLGAAGQSNYAAANALLDSLAGYRRHAGLTGQSLCWGLWEPQGQGMTAKLTRADLQRMKREGFATLSMEHGTELLDQALKRPDAVLVPAPLDTTVLAQRAGEVPAMLRALIGRRRIRSVAGKIQEAASLAERLRALPPEPRQMELQKLVQKEATAALGLTDGSMVPIDQPLRNLGLDSLMAFELRNRLHSLTGARPDIAGLWSASVQELASRLNSRIGEQAAPVPASPRSSEEARPAAPRQPSHPFVPSRAVRDRAEDAPQRQPAYLEEFIQEFCARTRASKAKAREERIPLTNHRDVAGLHSVLKELSYPIIAERAAGSRIWDLDGNEYIDLTMGAGSSLLGHGHPALAAALHEQVAAIWTDGAIASQAGETARLVSEMTGMERVAFFSSSSEAVRVAARLVRTVTARAKIAVFEGARHGLHEASDTLVLRYEDRESLAVIAARAHELAAVLVEPVPSHRPDVQPRGFLHELRELTRRNGIMLVFDETVTGFRIGPAGAQAWFGVQADLAIYGGPVGGGMPIGVVAGAAGFLNAIDGDLVCAHPLAMACAHALLRELSSEGPALQRTLNARTRSLCARLNDLFADEGLPVHVVHFASLIRFVLPPELTVLFHRLVANGVYVRERDDLFLTTAHSQSDIDRIVEVVRDAARWLARNVLPESEKAPSGFGLRHVPAATAVRSMFERSQRPDNAHAYNVPFALTVRGGLRMDRLEAAVTELVRRHDILRTCFRVQGEVLWQRVHPSGDFELSQQVLTESQIPAFLSQITRPFDLTTPTLLRCAVGELGPDHHLLVLNVHHLAVDGTSLDLLLNELFALYDNQVLAPMTTQYADFVEWESAYLDSATMRRDGEFWASTLSADMPRLKLPADFPRQEERRSGRAELEFRLTDPGTLRSFARERGVSANMLLNTVFQVFCSALSAQQDFCFGFPTAGRPNERFRGVLGTFIGIAVYRVRLDDRTTFAALLERTQGLVPAILEAQHYPFARLVSEYAGAGREPLFEVGFAYEASRARGPRRIGDLTLHPYPVPTLGVSMDLVLECIDDGETFAMKFSFNPWRYRRETIEKWAGSYDRLARQLIAAPDRLLSEVDRS